MSIKGIDKTLCVNCGQCYDICPNDVFAIAEGKVFVKYPEDCQSFALCLLVCPREACKIDNMRPTALPARSRT